MLAPRYMVPVLTSEHKRRFAVEGARVPFTVAMTSSKIIAGPARRVLHESADGRASGLGRNGRDLSGRFMTAGLFPLAGLRSRPRCSPSESLYTISRAASGWSSRPDQGAGWRP